MPKEVRDTYKQLERHGAIAVNVELSNSRWQASVLPWADGSGQISVNKRVREKEGLQFGQEIKVTIEPRLRN